MSTERRGWIRVGGDRCERCDQPFALDIEYRCVGCDHGVCALCVVFVRDRREAWCPACAPGTRDG